MERYNRKIREAYRKYLKGKRVVIVGPAPSMVGSRQGKKIDSFDVVVRLNKAVPPPPEMAPDIGKRTDVLYNCMNPSPECGGVIRLSHLAKKKIKFLVGAYPPLDWMGSEQLRLGRDITDFFNRNRSRFNEVKFCYFDNIKYFERRWSEMKLPNTGIMAILDLLKHDIRELYITGFTFFKGGYYRAYRPYNEKEVMAKMARFDLHQQAPQLKYMTRKLLESHRCKFDQALRQILENESQRPPSTPPPTPPSTRTTSKLKPSTPPPTPPPPSTPESPTLQPPPLTTSRIPTVVEGHYSADLLQKMISSRVNLWSAVPVY